MPKSFTTLIAASAIIFVVGCDPVFLAHSTYRKSPASDITLSESTDAINIIDRVLLSEGFERRDLVEQEINAGGQRGWRFVYHPDPANDTTGGIFIVASQAENTVHIHYREGFGTRQSEFLKANREKIEVAMRAAGFIPDEH